MKRIQHLCVIFICVCVGAMYSGCRGAQYYHNQGKVFGTFYSIQYEASEDMQSQIEACLHSFDMSLSAFNEQSVISRINRNEDVVTDEYFEQMYAQALEVSELSAGAFDITVAPLVNLWGFGFKHKEAVTQEKVDSILHIVNYLGLNLVDHHLYKRDARMQLDAGAIAKGYSCDVIGALLESKGVHNYMVCIGGEIVAKGVNSFGNPWQIGIEKPIDDPTGRTQDVQEIIPVTAVCMATSGNYRNYYVEDGVRRSHTIDPRTGYPVHHQLLSATVTADCCMRADALATACMVLGEKEGLALIESTEDASCYLIVADGETMKVVTSSRWNDIIANR